MVSSRFTDVPTVQAMFRDLRQIGDNAADELAANLMVARQAEVLGYGHKKMVRELTTLPPGATSLPILSYDVARRFLDDDDDCPEWARYFDPRATTENWSAFVGDEPDWRQLRERIARGETIDRAYDFFEAFGLSIGLGALYGALPVAYTAKRDIPVLEITARLVTDPGRRVGATARFVIDMMKRHSSDQPDQAALLPGGFAAREARRIRALHGAVRNMLAEDEESKEAWESAGVELAKRVNRGELGDIDEQRTIPRGRPINQLALLGTLLTLTVTVFDVLDKVGVHYEKEEKEAYFYLWSVVGAHLGIGVPSAASDRKERKILSSRNYFGDGRSLLPITPLEGERLMTILLEQEQGDTVAGQILTKALLREVARPLSQGMKPAPAVIIRYLLGDQVADMLAVPTGGWIDFAYRRLGGKSFLDRRARRRASIGWLGRLTSAEVSARFSRAAIEGFMALSDPRAMPFDIPDDLVRQWRIRAPDTPPDLVPFGEL